MRSKFIPEILLCPEPTFIMDAVIAAGFKGRYNIQSSIDLSHNLNLIETFDMYVGNVYPTEDKIGFKDARLGWDSLNKESPKNVTLTSERIKNLIDMVFLQSRTTKDKVYYNKLENKHIAVSYPLGQCLRYLSSIKC